jgi:1-acyl-sn-glycerol-3-phosphate acyltransferase
MLGSLPFSHNLVAMLRAASGTHDRPNVLPERPYGFSLHERDRTLIESMMPIWDWIYHSYFRVQADGWHHVPPEGPMLVVGSHNGGLAAPDMHMMMYDWFRRFGFDRPAYGLMHPKLCQALPALGAMAVKTGAIMAYPKLAIAALESGATVLVYPGGVQDVFRPHHQRDRIHLNGNQAFIKLALRQKVPIVPVISWGAHDTLWVLGDLYPWVKQWHEWGMPWLAQVDPEIFPIYLGLPWGISFGPLPNLPLPVQIHTRVLAPIWFESYGDEVSRDRIYVAECYERVRSTMQIALDELIQDCDS